MLIYHKNVNMLSKMELSKLNNLRLMNICCYFCFKHCVTHKVTANDDKRCGPHRVALLKAGCLQ